MKADQQPLGGHSEVGGYAQLAWMSRSARIADHAMIAVRNGRRGRGIAQALEAAQIAWAR